MTATIPTKEPAQLRAGDTLKWRREDLQSDYPATGYTLKYVAKNALGGFQITATADGSAFSVTVPASTSAGYLPGVYEWSAWVETGAEKYTVGGGHWTVLPDLRANDADSPLDSRDHARRVLDAIEAVIEKRATKDQMSMTIAGRAVSRMEIGDLIKFRQHYRQEVAANEAAARIEAGLGSGGGRVQVRF